MNWIVASKITIFGAAAILMIAPLTADAICYIFDYYDYESSTNTCKLKLHDSCPRRVNEPLTCKECQIQKIGSDGAEADKRCWYSIGEAGICDAIFSRWIFNHTTGVCENVMISGCPSDSIGFESSAECDTACKSLPLCQDFYDN